MPLAILEGTQNDFVFVTDDALGENSNRSDLAIKWCAHFGDQKPRDGFVVIENLLIENQEARFSWDFYNCDGSKAAMCGNAARCAILFIEKVTGQSISRWSSEIGTLYGQTEPNGAKVFLPLGQLEVIDKTILIDQLPYSGYFVNSGVPHFVLIQEDDSCALSKSVALKIMDHESFGPGRTNVTLLKESPSTENSFYVQSFERGVHEYTQACGTGAIAAASVLKKIKNENSWKIQMPGGLLGVELTAQGAFLSGPTSVLVLNPPLP